MDKDKIARGAAVFGSCYIKRWLEGQYDQLMDLPPVAKLKSLSTGTKFGIEAILYALTALAEQRISDQSPLGLMAKTVLMDAAPEIASRLMKDARADLTTASSPSSGVGQSEQAVASKLLALENGTLLGILTSIEEMDDAKRASFVSFAANASNEELSKFVALTVEQRNTLLKAHGCMGQMPSSSGSMASFKAFAKDFWVVFKAWSQKTCDVSLQVLNRYMLALLWVLKASGVLWGMAFFSCTASALCGRWALFGVLLVLMMVSGAGIFYGQRWQRKWLTFSAIVSAGVMALLVLLAAAGYPDSVFGVAVLFLVGVPTMAIGALLIPVTTVFEILRSLSPSGYRTLVRAFQMLLSAFFGILFFAVTLLMFPPQNPVAFLFIVPVVIFLALGVSVGLVRINPEMFLRAPVIMGMAGVLLVTLGLMSMPNLRNRLRTMPKRFDSAWVAAPKTVTFASSKDIGFVTPDGDVRIWYAVRSEGGYDLFTCEGVGPYYAPDGRRLEKADSSNIRQKIASWVDQVATKSAEEQRKAEQDRIERALAQQLEEQKRQADEIVRAEQAATQIAEAQRKAEQIRIARAMVQQAEEKKKQEEEIAKAEQERRASYLNTATLPDKVEYVVCAATATKEALNEFATALVQQLQGKGKMASSDVFATAFITTGGFESFYSGKGRQDIEAMPLAKMTSKILLVRCDDVVSKASTTISGLYNSTVRVSFKVLASGDGKVVDAFQLSAVGPGTSEADAKTAAFERILEQVSKRNL